MSGGGGSYALHTWTQVWAGHHLGLGRAEGKSGGVAATAARARTAAAASAAVAQVVVPPVTAAATEADRPTVREFTSPESRTNAPLDTVVAVTVRLPAGGGIDEATVNANTVKLFRGAATGEPIAGQPNTSGGGDAITFQPSDLLEPNTTYTFVVTDQVRDTHGNAFVPFSTTFTTGSAVVATDASIAFEKVFLNTAQGERYSSMAFGPDGRLYAATLTGLIHKFTVNADGTLSAPQAINTVHAANSGRRFLTGIRFDPASTPGNLILWVSHGQYVADNGTLNWNAPDWTGKISRLTGPGLGTYEDYVVGLPRSVRDHLTNQIDFGPDGALYVGQASNNSMGAPDPIWGNRPERLLSGAILRLDTAAVAARLAAAQGPLNAQTEETPTPYDPWAAGAPLTLHATGLRNVFDPIWHRNGRLYAPTNGSAAGGYTPGFAGGTAPRRIDQTVNGPLTGPAVPALNDVQTTEFDYLFKIDAGGYYGHPNPIRGEYVLQGGNPTAGVDDDEFTQYPVGTLPDRNRRNDIYTFGRNYSPTGSLEFKGGAFGGVLDGRLLVARYSGGDDIVVIQLDANGNVAGVQSGLAGLTHFVDPLDIAQDPTTGFLYVSEYGSKRITLLRPIAAGANITPSNGQMVFNDVVGGAEGPARTLTITNTGTTPLAIPSDGLKISGTDAGMFRITGRPVLPATIAPGAAVQLTLAFQAPSGTVGAIKTAALEIKSNDPDQQTIAIALRGLPTAGTGGANEPSLQRILNLYNIGTNVGDADPNTGDLYSNAQPIVGPNDELPGTRLVKAGPGPVTVETLAVFGVSTNPSVRLGWYDAGSPQGRTELFTVNSADSQSVAPSVNGNTAFDPGAKSFGFYSIWPGFSNREIFSEDALNTIEATAANRHKVRYYRLKNPDGSVVPNALVMAHEEFINAPNGNYDNQDVVAIVRNVNVAPEAPEIGTENVSLAPWYDRLAFFRIQNNPGHGVHDLSTLRLRNTGSTPLNVTGVSILGGPYQVAAAPGLPGAIAPGGTADVTVRFIATAGDISPGVLRITSNDPDEPTLDIPLSGFWQSVPENQQEPGLDEILNVFDYRTALVAPGQVLSNGGRLEAVGDEVLSPYWVLADANKAATVTQLAAFHTVNEGHAVRWHFKGNTAALATVLTHSTTDAQTLLPRNATNTGPATATFKPGSATPFGFKVQNEWSDPNLNPKPNATDQGHHVRFFPLRDRAGGFVKDAWLMVMDFSGINYDYNDNVYLISNIRPENAAAPVGLVAAVRPEGGFQVAWQPSPERRVSGYNVYRSLNASSGFVKINGAPVTTASYHDAAASRGATYYYRVTATDNWGGESAQSASVRTDVTPPAPVTSLTAAAQAESILLSWAAPADTDLAGYRILRSDLPDGIYTALNGGQLVAGTTFSDVESPGGFTWHYRVVAVDASGNESEPAATSAEREGGLGFVLSAPNVEAGGAPSYGFGVTFSNKAVFTAESLANAVIVTGPGGFAQAAQVSAINGRTVSFTITPPGGTWNSADGGTYTVQIEANKVGDGAGNFIPPQAMGTFAVAIPPEYPGATQGNAIDLGTFTRVGKKFGGKRIQRDILTPGTKSDLFYSFTIAEPARLKASLAKFRHDLNFELRDAAGNVLMTSAKLKRKPEKLMRALPAGTYVLRVTHVGAAETPFIMKMSIGKPTKRDLALLGGS